MVKNIKIMKKILIIIGILFFSNVFWNIAFWDFQLEVESEKVNINDNFQLKINIEVLHADVDKSEYIATHDTLTELPNRLFFNKKLDWGFAPMHQPSNITISGLFLYRSNIFFLSDHLLIYRTLVI